MEYLLAYRFVFQSRNWVKNLLVGSLSLFVPIVGMMVFVGYLFEVIEWLHRRRQEDKLPWVERPDAPAAPPPDAVQAEPRPPATYLQDAAEGAYPDFDVNRLQNYLTRGVWPFLVQLVVHLPVSFLFIGLYVVAMVLVGVGGATGGPVWVYVTIFLAVFALAVVLAIASMVLVVPLYLRAGLSRDFGSAFSMAYLKDFLSRVGKELILSQLYLQASGALLSVVGMLACYVGIFPAMALWTMAAHHLEYQLYELYLERGGAPILPRDARPAEKSA